MSGKEFRGRHYHQGLGWGRRLHRDGPFDLSLKGKLDFSMFGVGGGHSGSEARNRQRYGILEKVRGEQQPEDKEEVISNNCLCLEKESMRNIAIKRGWIL